MGARPRGRGRRTAELSVPPLHLVATDEVADEPGFEEIAATLLGIGGPSLALHLRLREATGATLHALAARLAPVAVASGALLLVNDRVDVALAAGCAGVQLGGRGMEAREARWLLGPGRLIGASVHSLEEARAAEGADFLLAGTLYPTASHPGRAAAGLALLESIRGVPIPRIGIGGITPARVPDVLGAGAAGVAVVRGVWGAPSPRQALIDYLSALGQA